MQTYENDIFARVTEQANLLRSGRSELLNIPPTAEIIEPVGHENR
ncbi:hypothetical protein [Lamprocystis purpurea]|jgi:hypothetical protein|nr:hypothetical protein [Lamprocystis purpurea]